MAVATSCRDLCQVKTIRQKNPQLPRLYDCVSPRQGLLLSILPACPPSPWFNMRRSQVRAWLFLATITAGTLAAQEWLAPSFAHASCGDYLTFVGPDGKPLPGHGARSASPSEAPQGPVRVPCGTCPQRLPGSPPCQGPWCTDNHPPAPAPTTTIERLQETWASLAAVLGHTDIDSAPFALAFEHHSRIHHVPAIDPPPRHV
jgi:hypothetical protein